MDNIMVGEAQTPPLHSMAALTTACTQYRQRRRQFYERHQALWPGTLAEPYDLLEAYALSRRECTAILHTSAAIAQLYNRTAVLLRSVPDETLRAMGLPGAVLKTARASCPALPDVIIGRVDLVQTPDGYKMFEFNTDSPGLWVEAFSVNGSMCKECGKADPNRDSASTLGQAMQKAIHAGLSHLGKAPGEPAVIVFTAPGTFAEDKGSATYLMELVQLPGHFRKQYVALEALQVDADGFYDADGQRIDILVRVYPFDALLSRRFQTKNELGTRKLQDALLGELVQHRQLVLINPPAAFLLQSKAMQAIIWGLHEANLYFSAEEHCLIARHMLPTYMDPVFHKEKYVVKPVYGSQGDTVSIIDPRRGETWQNGSSTYTGQPMVYQKYVEMPRAELMTEEGIRQLQLLTTCFLIAGEPTGIGMRAGRDITDDSWWFLPVYVED